MLRKRTFTLILSGPERSVSVPCTWNLAGVNKESQATHTRSLDLVIGPSKVPLRGPYIHLEELGGVLPHSRCDEEEQVQGLLQPSSTVASFLQYCITINRKQLHVDGGQATVKLLLPTTDGYIVRSDFLQRRLEGFEPINRVEGFVAPRGAVKSAFSEANDQESFVALASLAIGGILLKGAGEVAAEVLLQDLERQLYNRISFSWLLPNPISQRRLIWLDFRNNMEVTLDIYKGAYALGISLMVIGDEGHWLQHPNSQHLALREAFISANLQCDSGLLDRLTDAVRSRKDNIDGIGTISDARLVHVAQLCERLGFQTSPSTAFGLAGDKYKTRMMELDNHGSFKVSGVSEIKQIIQSGTKSLPPYPLIVKPCMGWMSEGVSKASSEQELLRAVEKASSRHALAPQRRTDVIIEPYIDGPEIDVNIVLLHGEILFCEISDGFPGPGDASNATQENNFLETVVVLPTRLPEEEKAIIRDSIHKSILRQGFRSGVFHCEARLVNSKMHYAMDNGEFDLQQNHAKDYNGEVSVYLIEINARPPGHIETIPVRMVYGVDYFALQLLFHVPNEEERIRALCKSFSNGPQCILGIVCIHEDRPGIMKTYDAGAELLSRCEDLKANVAGFWTSKKRGAKLVGPNVNGTGWIATFWVVSKTGRRRCLQVIDKIQRSFRYELE